MHTYSIYESLVKNSTFFSLPLPRGFFFPALLHTFFFVRSKPLPVLDFPPILESFLIELRLEHARLGAGDRWITYWFFHSWIAEWNTAQRSPPPLLFTSPETVTRCFFFGHLNLVPILPRLDFCQDFSMLDGILRTRFRAERPLWSSHWKTEGVRAKKGTKSARRIKAWLR